MLINELSKTFTLTAADCNAQMEMPLWSLAMAIVERATDHANELGIGYTRLEPRGLAWVLMRLTIEMERPIRVGETYRITTWVEDFNRRFSERCFRIDILDGDNATTIGQARTIWSTINSTTRQAATLDGLEELIEVKNPHGLAFQQSPRVRPVDFETGDDHRRMDYRVVVSDIDTNRHLTAPRYISLMLDLWPLEQYDEQVITRFEIAYSNEALPADELTVEAVTLADGSNACRLLRGGDTLSQATLRFSPRK